MKTLDINDVFIYGEMGRRALMTQDRFAMEDFAPDSEKTYRDIAYDWPGDNEGRLILALVQLSRCTRKTAKYLDAIMKILPLHLNDKGYFGEVLPDGFISEQQAAGTSWVLRSLIEYYRWTNDSSILQAIHKIIENYLFPLADAIDSYPSTEEVGRHEGFVEGRLIDGRFDKWYLSTDTGCLFIMLDGAAHAFEMYKDDRLKHLIETMIYKFMQIDVVKLSFQTHSTLSCLRGILKYYELDGNVKYLKIVEAYYRIYKQEGMTANYENYNWFNRPLWTEPCAIVDAFILAVSLWKHTGAHEYLDDAHLMMYNGVYRVQRLNGGFGCDSCAGVADDFIAPNEAYYEAWWCCSKRGAEFFFEAGRHLYLTQDEKITVVLYENSSAEMHFPDGELTVQQTTGYPVDGYVQLDFVRSDITDRKTFLFYIPDYVLQETINILVDGKTQKVIIKDGFVQVDLIPVSGSKIELFFDVPLRTIPAPGKHTLPDRMLLMHGPLILSLRSSKEQDLPVSLAKAEQLSYLGNAMYADETEELVFKPSSQCTYISRNQMLSEKEQILFLRG
ncbi:MAG: beta-L-arabinofuranosidase domain-containing protein [Saccharofermentanales bacterium]